LDSILEDRNLSRSRSTKKWSPKRDILARVKCWYHESYG